MAETTQGISGYIHGVTDTSPTAATFQSLRQAKSDELVTYIKDEAGKRITMRSDDQTTQITGVCKIKTTFTRLAIAATLTIAGGDFAGEYIVMSTDEGQVNGDFTEYTFVAMLPEYINPT
jgi:hypothetical protein